MNKTLLSLAIVVLAVANLIIGYPKPDQYPLDEKVLVEITPRAEEEIFFEYSQLLWLDDVVEYDGVNSVNIRREDWQYGLKSVCIASEAWSIHISEANVNVTWCDSNGVKKKVFVNKDEGLPTDPIY